jgi:hypothetical protein
MKFVFLSTAGDAEHYVAEKLKAQMNRAHDERPMLQAPPQSMLQNALAHLKNPVPRIASEAEFFEINNKQKLLVEVAKRCAIQELVESAPLIEGEEIEEDFFSYLLEPWHDVPAYTAVLKRRTNRAEVLYIFDLVQIDRGTIVHLNPPGPELPRPVPPRLGISFEITGAMVKQLLKWGGKQAAGVVVSKLGAVVLNLVMKELFGMDDTQRLIDEVKKIIKDEIESNEITKIEGALAGTLQFLTVEYRHQKDKMNLDKVENRKILLTDLKSYSNKFYTDVIGTLKQEKYAIRGLKTFTFAASVHLLITQEMALVDPDYLNPNDSG